MTFLEQLVAEWHSFLGYYVRTNVMVGKREKGGWEGELDVVAFHPTTKELIHIETSMDALSWAKRRERYARKFETGRRYIPELFPFTHRKHGQVVVVGFPRGLREKYPLGKDIEVVLMPDLIRQSENSMMYFPISCGKPTDGGVLLKSFHQALEVMASEFPFEGPGDLFIVILESEDSGLELLGGSEVVGRQDLSLKDREVDLDLVEPTGMHRSMHQDEVVPAALEPVDAGLTPVRRTVVDDPEHARSRPIGFAGHDLEHQAVERLDPGLRLAPPENPGLFHVPRRDIGKRSHAAVFMFDAPGPGRCGGQGRMATRARLDAGLFIGADDPLVLSQRSALPEALVEIEDAASLCGKVGITGEDPAPVVPRLDGVLGQPTPNRGFPNGGHNPPIDGGSL
jgi:hypothetical protein